MVNIDFNLLKYKDASLEELKNARDEYLTLKSKADSAATYIRHLIVSKKSELAKEKFPDLNKGDKVEILWSDRFGMRHLDTFFFDSITERAKESPYMCGSPFFNFALPKKDGKMGKRFRSIDADLVLDIKKVQL